MNVLFLCVHNAGRSQIASAFARKCFKKGISIYSAGSLPADEIHPVVIEAMKEKGFDLSSSTPVNVNKLSYIAFDYVITMGCGDICPVTTTSKKVIEWDIDDPRDQKIEVVRVIRDKIESLVAELAVNLKKELVDANSL